MYLVGYSEMLIHRPMSRASDDLENPERLRSLLKDLREARQAKSRDGLRTLDHSELSVRVLSIITRPCIPLTRPISFRISVPWKLTKSDLSSFKPCH